MRSTSAMTISPPSDRNPLTRIPMAEKPNPALQFTTKQLLLLIAGLAAALLLTLKLGLLWIVLVGDFFALLAIVHLTCKTTFFSRYAIVLCSLIAPSFYVILLAASFDGLSGAIWLCLFLGAAIFWLACLFLNLGVWPLIVMSAAITLYRITVLVALDVAGKFI